MPFIKNIVFFNKPIFSLFLFLILFPLVISAQNPFDSNDIIIIDRQEAALLLETASTLEKSLNYLDKNLNMNFNSNLKDLSDFVLSLEKDIGNKSSGNAWHVIIKSHTLEQFGNFGLSKLPDVVDFLIDKKVLPATYKLPPTFGLEDFTVAISRHIGSGKTDIETITYYLDGFNKACWAIVGYMVGGLKTADLYQTIAGTSVKLLKELTISLFEKGVIAWRKQDKQVIDDWLTVQQRRVFDGLIVQPISEVYKKDLLQKNGLTDKKIEELDKLANDVNQTTIKMKQDFNVRQMETFKHSNNLELGGIYIDPVVIYAGKGGGNIRDKVKNTRTGKDSLSWPITIPKRKVKK